MNKENKGLCPQCHDYEIYSSTLTHGLCLNCHYRNEEETRQMEIELEADEWQRINE